MMGPSPHKPRRKAGRKTESVTSNASSSSTSTATTAAAPTTTTTTAAAAVSSGFVPAKRTSADKTVGLGKQGGKLGRPGGNATAQNQSPDYPLAAFFWPLRGGAVSQWEVLPLILMVVGLFRWAAGLWGYSGLDNPPMHGDYEAQRHWMEITTHLPVSQWYFHDLEWWGLDYPPLTAYHSRLLGAIGSLIDPSWFALHTSRGSDDPKLKVFMRATVIASEFLVYVPAAVVFVRRLTQLSPGARGIETSSIALVAVLMQPATILIDHVHFQYNTVMLGLVLASASSMLAGRNLWACVLFVAALGFKQMALYYAPAVFAYLLGVCVFPRVSPARFLAIAAVTLASFAALLAPLLLAALYEARVIGVAARPELEGFPAPLPLLGALSYRLDQRAWYYPPVQQTAQLLHRVFPFARGLFEDKVANFWCALNVVHKLRALDAQLLRRASLLLTLAAITPPCALIFWLPHRKLLPLALAATSFAFFLFSFQVHEKSILLPLMPLTALFAGDDGLSKGRRAWIGFANMLGVWTLYPLLARVDLAVPYAVLSLLWAYLLGLPPTSLNLYSSDVWGSGSLMGVVTTVVHLSFYAAMALWHVIEATVPPPSDKPDLWVVANVGIGALGFGVCYLWCLGSLIVESGVLGLGSSNTGKGSSSSNNGTSGRITRLAATARGKDVTGSDMDLMASLKTRRKSKK